jgi:glycosyltransferase involved in cell wall biosynthesis
MSRAVSPLSQLRSIALLAASIRSDPPDLIHTHTPVGGVVGRFAAALVGFRPVIHTFHGLAYEGAPQSPVDRAFLAAERFAALRTTYFFSQGTEDLAVAVKLGIARSEDSLVIGNGVDIAHFAPDRALRESVREELRLSRDDIVVLTVARLVREKGILDLADAAVDLADVKSLRFLLVGTALPSDRTSVASELKHHRVHRLLGVRWQQLGHRTDVDRLLNASDIYVLPSYREGLPRSAIEAMAVGLPVVLTRIPAGEELVLPGENGLLIQPGAVDELAAAIRSLAGDPTRRQTMGRRARQLATVRHDESVVVGKQLDVLEELVLT